MRLPLLVCIVMGMCAGLQAHHPDREHRPTRQRIDLIGPIGNRLPMSYRRRYNRPRYVTGKLMYWIEPVSLEAMTWHRAEHLGYNDKKTPRMVTHYFYPKPWEVLPIGARPNREVNREDAASEPDAPETRVGMIDE